jgi:hypothetical protein
VRDWLKKIGAWLLRTDRARQATGPILDEIAEVALVSMELGTSSDPEELNRQAEDAIRHAARLVGVKLTNDQVIDLRRRIGVAMLERQLERLGEQVAKTKEHK